MPRWQRQFNLHVATACVLACTSVAEEPVWHPSNSTLKHNTAVAIKNVVESLEEVGFGGRFVRGMVSRSRHESDLLTVDITRDQKLRGFICAAAPPNLIRCFFDDLAELQRLSGNEQTWRVVLLYVIAHETGHILLNHHSDALGEPPLALDLRLPLAEKMDAVMDHLQRIPSDIRRESDADDLAVKVLTYWAMRQPYYSPMLGLALSTVNNMVVPLRTVFGSPPFRGSPVFMKPRYPVTDAEVSKDVQKLMCELARPEGQFEFPHFYADHPDWPTRVAAVTSELDRHQRRITARPIEPSHTSFFPDLTEAAEIWRDTTDVASGGLAALDREYAKYYEIFRAKLAVLASQVKQGSLEPCSDESIRKLDLEAQDGTGDASKRTRTRYANHESELGHHVSRK